MGYVSTKYIKKSISVTAIYDSLITKTNKIDIILSQYTFISSTRIDSDILKLSVVFVIPQTPGALPHHQFVI
jgi:hypothetical protein